MTRHWHRLLEICAFNEMALRLSLAHVAIALGSLPSFQRFLPALYLSPTSTPSNGKWLRTANDSMCTRMRRRRDYASYCTSLLVEYTSVPVFFPLRYLRHK